MFLVEYAHIFRENMKNSTTRAICWTAGELKLCRHIFISARSFVSHSAVNVFRVITARQILRLNTLYQHKLKVTQIVNINPPNIRNFENKGWPIIALAIGVWSRAIRAYSPNWLKNLVCFYRMYFVFSDISKVRFIYLFFFLQAAMVYRLKKSGA